MHIRNGPTPSIGAFEDFPAALTDLAIRSRLHHIHLVQAAFLWVTKDPTAKFVITKVEDYPDMAGLKVFARRYYPEISATLIAMGKARLAETISVPWFRTWQA
jgi:hypothetical protein